MSDKRRLLSRRDVLKGSAALGAAALVHPSLGQFAWAASKDQVIVYNASAMDNLHPTTTAAAPFTACGST